MARQFSDGWTTKARATARAAVQVREGTNTRAEPGARVGLVGVGLVVARSRARRLAESTGSGIAYGYG